MEGFSVGGLDEHGDILSDSIFQLGTDDSDEPELLDDELVPGGIEMDDDDLI